MPVATRPCSGRVMFRHPSDGHSLIELLFVAGIIATASGIAVPQMLAGLDDSRAVGATRYLSSRLYRARARRRSCDPPTSRSSSCRWATAATRSPSMSTAIGTACARRTSTAASIAALGGVERLGDSFKGVEFGTIRDLPAVDPDGAKPGGDPIRLGASGFATFTALGTATPGSLYVRSARGAQ